MANNDSNNKSINKSKLVAENLFLYKNIMEEKSKDLNNMIIDLDNTFTRGHIYNLLNNTNKKIKRIDEIQSEIVNFCRDINFLQKKSSFYSINLFEQMEFNKCVDHILDKIKSDLVKLEENSKVCIENCGEKDIYNDQKYILSKSEPNPGLFVNTEAKQPRCIITCKEMYQNMSESYIKYLTTYKGIFIEFIDINKYLI